MSFLRWAALGSTAAYHIYKYRKLPRPKGMPIGQLILPIGGGDYIGIPRRERLKHLHIMGATGNGKTTLMKNLILQDMREGNGFCVIDPRGKLVDDILRHVPPNRVDDVVLFDATDRNNPLGFNILEWVEVHERSRTASEVVSVFKKLYELLGWGPRLEYFLRFAVLTLLEIPGSTLLDIPDLFLNDEFLDSVLENITDPVLNGFWRQEYKVLSGGQKTQAVSPILNKIGPWITYPESRMIVGQRQSSFDIRYLMDNRKILLVKIPQGILGEDISAFMGAMLVAKIQLAAMTRANVPQDRLVPFYLYVDEFQNFLTSAFEKILTEARSYGLGLIVANQYKEQLPRDQFKALENNVAVRLLCNRRGASYHIEYEIPQDVRKPVINVRPLPPIIGGDSSIEKEIRQLSRLRYARPRFEVEEQIALVHANRRMTVAVANNEQPITFKEV